MTTAIRSAALGLLLALVLAPGTAPAQQQPGGDVFDPFFRFGDTAHKVYAQEAPGETVDPFTGNLRVVQEDLVLPGKGGLDLHVVRTYSSKIWSRSDLLDVSPLLAESAGSMLGYGWSMHMGRLRNPYAIVPVFACGAGEFPVFDGADGETRVFYPVNDDVANRVYQSKDRWRLEVNCKALGGDNSGACVWSSSGIRYEMSNAPGNPFWEGTRPVWPVTAIVDANDNRIAVSYVPSTGAVASITDTYGRVVEFSYKRREDGLRLDTVIANGKAFTYSYTEVTSSETSGPGRIAVPGMRRFLTAVQPPAGRPYEYEYGYTATVEQNQYALTKIVNPHGGTTEYGYQSRPFFTGRETVWFPVVSSRTVGGRALPSGTWRYTYTSPPPVCHLTGSCAIDPATGHATSRHVTIVQRPDGLFDSFVLFGFGALVDLSTATKRQATYAVGLTLEAARANRSEVEAFKWIPDEVQVVSSAPFVAPVYGANCGAQAFVSDDRVLAPLLEQHSVFRDGASFITRNGDWDAFGQPRTVVETGDQSAFPSPLTSTRTTTWEYFSAKLDSMGATLNMVRGRPRRQRVCVAGAECFENAWTYDGPGHLRDSETVSGVTTWFGHHTTGDLATVTNALGQTLSFSSYSNGVPTRIDLNGAYAVTRDDVSWEGWIRSETNGRGFATRYDHDAIGRILTVAPPGSSLPTSYEYAPDNRPDGEAVRTTRGTYRSLSTLDGLGRVVSTSDTEGIQSQLVYDAMGNVRFRSHPFSDASGPSGDWMDYDGLGRVKVLIAGYDPANPSATCEASGACDTKLEYFGNCTQTIVHRAQYDYVATWRCYTSYGDPREARLTSLEDAMGRFWTYAYNASGRLVDVGAPVSSGNRAFAYDANQFLRSEKTAESGTVTLGRNAIGQMTSRADARNVRAEYRYEDPVGRLTGVLWGTDDDVSRKYEKENLKRVATRKAGAMEYGYDERNRVRSATWTFRGVTYTTGYDYDEMGCLTSVVYPTGTRVTMTCDGLNRPTGVWIQLSGGASDSLVSDVAYHPSGQPAHVVYGNGVVTDAMYDGRARLSTLRASSKGRNIAGLTYGYDGANNVVSFDNTAEASAARTMGYDQLERLVSVTAPGQWGTTTYWYDELGNLTSKWRQSGETLYGYDPDTNRLAYSTGAALRPLSLTWDEPGRLATSSDGTTYAYDADGRRIQKSDASGATVYHYDAAGRVIAETRPDGTKLRDYVYLGNKLIAVDGCVGMVALCAEREWYHTDALGSVLARTDFDGNVTAQLDYEAFGERWSAAGLVTGVDGDRQYNGRVYDQGTGFHDYGARLYWPEIGRFISADSYLGDPGNPASLNRYSYVHNNPYKYVDPSGHNPLLVGALIALLFIENDQHANLAPFAAAVAPGPAAAVLNAAGAKSLADGKYQQAEQAFAGALLSAFVGKAAAGESAALNNGAQSAANGLKLGKQLASEAQSAELMSTGGEPIAGAGTDVTLRSAGRLAAEHGGKPADWAKVRSSNYKAKDGTSFETHGYRNTQTGEVKELKTKFQ